MLLQLYLLQCCIATKTSDLISIAIIFNTVLCYLICFFNAKIVTVCVSELLHTFSQTLRMSPEPRPRPSSLRRHRFFGGDVHCLVAGGLAEAGGARRGGQSRCDAITGETPATTSAVAPRGTPSTSRQSAEAGPARPPGPLSRRSGTRRTPGLCGIQPDRNDR